MQFFPTIQIKRGNTAGIVPAGLTYGELAVNVGDGKLYVGDQYGNTILIGFASSGGGGEVGGNNFTFGATAPAGASAGDMWFDSIAGSLLFYIDDGDSQQWVEVSGGGGGGGSIGATGATGATGPAGTDADATAIVWMFGA